MSKLNSILLFVSILILNSCTKSIEKEIKIDTALKTDHIYSKSIKTSSKLFLYVEKAVIYKSMFVTVNNSSDPNLFNVFSFPDFQLLGSISGYGKGPGEFIKVN